MIILVNDANILIDLLKLDLIDHFFDLDYEFHVTDFVMAEIQEENTGKLDVLIQNGKLMKRVFEFDEMGRISDLESKHPGLSIADCSCLYLAGGLSAVLLTGDAALRKNAERHNINVHGLLWVFDQLVNHSIVTRKTARDKLKMMMATNPRLPSEECKKRLQKWQEHL